MQPPVIWVAKYRNQDPEDCHIFRLGFLVAATDENLVGWSGEVGVSRFGGMLYRKEIEAEMVRWVVVYL